MQQRDKKSFKGGLNVDDNPNQLPQEDYTLLKNARALNSDQQHGAGNIETLQSEIQILINPDAAIIYYGDAIGGSFIYSGYQEVTIGNQTWMKRNYDADYPGSKIYSETDTGTDEAANLSLYGRLYTHNQIMSLDFCPVGWHVPTEAEIDELIAYLTSAAVAGGKLKEVGTSHWTTPNTGADDIAGFRALPGGKYDNAFEQLGLKGLLWLADEGVPQPPVLLNPSEIAYVSFVANWKASDGATGYYLDVSESPTFASFMMGYGGKDVGNVRAALVEGLESFTTYYFRVLAYNEIGASDDSLTGTATTKSSLKDKDGNLYNIVNIGNQQWLVENLKTTKYADGSTIPLVTDPTLWAAQRQSNKEIYGGLYNWYAATYNAGGASIAPAGWHVPTVEEWETLITYLGGSSIAGGKLKEIGTTHWSSPNTGASNSSGFTAISAGARGSYGVFNGIPYFSGWWSSTLSKVVTSDSDDIVDVNYSKFLGLSLRLIKDDSTDPGTLTDYDGNVYPTVKIGTQVWMAENLKVEHFNDGTVIPKVTDNTAWAALETAGMCYYDNDDESDAGAMCYYDNEIDNKAIYGALYNWFAVNNSRKLAEGQFSEEGVLSEGWRVPTDADWQVLITDLGGSSIAGGKLKEAGLAHWTPPNLATNETRFTALPSGSRTNDGAFLNLLSAAFFQSTTENNINTNLIKVLVSSYFVVITNIGYKTEGISVRCMRDITTYSGYKEFTPPASVTGVIRSGGHTVVSGGKVVNIQ